VVVEVVEVDENRIWRKWRSRLEFWTSTDVFEEDIPVVVSLAGFKFEDTRRLPIAMRKLDAATVTTLRIHA
jgi:hypothetical protein